MAVNDDRLYNRYFRVSLDTSPTLVLKCLEEKIEIIDRTIELIGFEDVSRRPSDDLCVRLIDQQDILKRLRTSVSEMAENGWTWVRHQKMVTLEEQVVLYEIVAMLGWQSKILGEENEEDTASILNKDRGEQSLSESSTKSYKAKVNKTSRDFTEIFALEDQIATLRRELKRDLEDHVLNHIKVVEKAASNRLDNFRNASDECIGGICETLTAHRQEIESLKAENANMAQRVEDKGEESSDLQAEVDLLKTKEAVMEQTIVGLVKSLDDLKLQMGTT